MKTLSLAVLAMIFSFTQPGPKPPRHGGTVHVMGAVGDTTRHTLTLRDFGPQATAAAFTVHVTNGVTGWTRPVRQPTASLTAQFTVSNTTAWPCTDFALWSWGTRGNETSRDSTRIATWRLCKSAPPVGPPTGGTVTPDTSTAPVDPALLFFDDFRTGAKAPAQNGVSWTGVNCGTATSGDLCPRVVADPANPSGFSLAFTFGGGALGDDAFSEQNLRLPDPTAVHFCEEWGVPANYVHRSDNESNNKGLRIFGGKAANVSRDSAYRYGVSSGWSTYPRSDAKSLNQPEHGWSGGGGVGPFNTGNGGIVFTPGAIERHGFYVRVGTFQGTLGHWEGATYVQPTGNGIIRTWLNGVLTYDKTNLPLYRDGFYNRWQYSYILGWANSGFTQTTTLLLRWIKISLSPIAGCTA